MVRPEHVTWNKTGHDDLGYSGVVLSVSYVGERYEVRVQIEGLGMWTAYANQRVRIGESVQLYVSPERICRMDEQQQQQLGRSKPDQPHDMNQGPGAKQREVIAAAN